MIKSSGIWERSSSSDGFLSQYDQDNSINSWLNSCSNDLTESYVIKSNKYWSGYDGYCTLPSNHGSQSFYQNRSGLLKESYFTISILERDTL